MACQEDLVTELRKRCGIAVEMFRFLLRSGGNNLKVFACARSLINLICSSEFLISRRIRMTIQGAAVMRKIVVNAAATNTVVHSEGFLLLNFNYHPIFANSAATEILSY